MQRRAHVRFERGALAALVVFAHLALIWLFIQARVAAPEVDSAEAIVAVLLDRPRGVPPGSAPASADAPTLTPRISWAPPVLDIVLNEESEAPLADQDAPQPEPQLASQPSGVAKGAGTEGEGVSGGGTGVTIVQRVLPKYPQRSVRLGEEGTVVVQVQVNEKGRVSDIRVARGSGHQRLDSAALEAVRRWKFIPAVRESRPVSTWGETELRFVLYPFVFSRVAEQPLEEQIKAGVTEEATAGGATGLRHFIQTFSGAGFAEGAPSHASREIGKLRDALEAWGPVQAVEFKAAFGDHRWSRYDIKPQYRTGTTGNTVDLRWDIYEVRHERGTSLWRIALDRNGTVWAAHARDASVDP
jgi:periplasmic protein TonB